MPITLQTTLFSWCHAMVFNILNFFFFFNYIPPTSLTVLFMSPPLSAPCLLYVVCQVQCLTFFLQFHILLPACALPIPPVQTMVMVDSDEVYHFLFNFCGLKSIGEQTGCEGGSATLPWRRKLPCQVHHRSHLEISWRLSRRRWCRSCCMTCSWDYMGKHYRWNTHWTYKVNLLAFFAVLLTPCWLQFRPTGLPRHTLHTTSVKTSSDCQRM